MEAPEDTRSRRRFAVGPAKKANAKVLGAFFIRAWREPDRGPWGSRFRTILVKTEAFNRRAIGFYKKSGFAEAKSTGKVGRFCGKNCAEGKRPTGARARSLRLGE